MCVNLNKAIKICSDRLWLLACIALGLTLAALIGLNIAGGAELGMWTFYVFVLLTAVLAAFIPIGILATFTFLKSSKSWLDVSWWTKSGIWLLVFVVYLLCSTYFLIMGVTVQ